MTSAHRRILLVEDDAPVRRALRDALRGSGYEVTEVENGVRALASLAAQPSDVIVSDVRMPDMDGLALLTALRERGHSADVIMMTAFDDMGTVVEAMKRGAAEFLVKPIDLDDLLRTLERVFGDQELRRLRKPAPEMAPTATLVGRDPKMIELYKLVGQAASSPGTTVLVRGESGTGKELVARAIHAHSAAAGQPFVPVNCAALPATLLESELFGHTRGAFTGAVGARRGRFALAANGTIFLDEIGDTSLDFQTKLLRVLQDREFQPVGSDETERTAARVIAATHQNLEALVSGRQFREDLYYRLRVVDIFIPPLRDRPSDILRIAEHVLQRAAAMLGASPAVIAPDAATKLQQHGWPGNVRELEHALMRAVVIAPAGVIRAQDLSLASPSGTSEPTATALRDIEAAHITRMLAVASGNKSRAADLLGIPRARLQRLISKYGIE